MDRFNVWVGSLIARPQNLKKDDGQTFVEYALVLSVIVIALLVLTAWTGLGTQLTNAINTVGNSLPG